MIQLVVHTITPRIEYIAEIVFRVHGEEEYCIHTVDDYKKSITTWYYGNDEQAVPEKTVWIKKEFDILESTSINDSNFHQATIPSLIWKTKNQTYFDLFAWVFFFLTRLEEVQPNLDTDIHNRYLPQQSLAFKQGKLEEPFVDYWLQELFKHKTLNRKFTKTPTIDLDTGFKFSHKGLLRSVGASFRDFFIGKFSDFITRFKVLLGLTKDPFNIYKSQLPALKKKGYNPHIFILNASKGEFDTSLPKNGRGIKKICKQLAKHSISFGLHPSYQSSNTLGLIKSELLGLEKTSRNKITSSRQHFLRLQIPTTYQNLEALSITDDYSMGYPQLSGFRASTSVPYPFFDVLQNKALKVTIFPACFMDGNFFQYNNISENVALEKIRLLEEKVTQAKGHFIGIWHEATICKTSKWHTIFNAVYN